MGVDVKCRTSLFVDASYSHQKSDVLMPKQVLKFYEMDPCSPNMSLISLILPEENLRGDNEQPKTWVTN